MHLHSAEKRRSRFGVKEHDLHAQRSGRVVEPLVTVKRVLHLFRRFVHGQVQVEEGVVRAGGAHVRHEPFGLGEEAGAVSANAGRVVVARLPVSVGHGPPDRALRRADPALPQADACDELVPVQQDLRLRRVHNRTGAARVAQRTVEVVVEVHRAVSRGLLEQGRHEAMLQPKPSVAHRMHILEALARAVGHLRGVHACANSELRQLREGELAAEAVAAIVARRAQGLRSL
mmetsp:Transcript_125268/g.359807  ORF Transcript_125268/g.359807 Transcript_125268/m.359807 type:complete len:231 (-) Transcript_125268:607-1299(-)